MKVDGLVTIKPKVDEEPPIVIQSIKIGVDSDAKPADPSTFETSALAEAPVNTDIDNEADLDSDSDAEGEANGDAGKYTTLILRLTQFSV